MHGKLRNLVLTLHPVPFTNLKQATEARTPSSRRAASCFEAIEDRWLLHDSLTFAFRCAFLDRKLSTGIMSSSCSRRNELMQMIQESAELSTPPKKKRVSFSESELATVASAAEMPTRAKCGIGVAPERWSDGELAWAMKRWMQTEVQAVTPHQSDLSGSHDTSGPQTASTNERLSSIALTVTASTPEAVTNYSSTAARMASSVQRAPMYIDGVPLSLCLRCYDCPCSCAGRPTASHSRRVLSWL